MWLAGLGRGRSNHLASVDLFSVRRTFSLECEGEFSIISGDLVTVPFRSEPTGLGEISKIDRSVRLLHPFTFRWRYLAASEQVSTCQPGEAPLLRASIE